MKRNRLVQVKVETVDVGRAAIFHVVGGDGETLIRFCRQLAALGSAILVAVVLAGASSGAAQQPSATAIGGKVTIAVSLKLTQQGTFTARGAVSDRGLARGRQTVSGNRARMTITLDSKTGRIKLLVTQACGKSKHVERHLRVRPVQGPVGRRQGKRPAHVRQRRRTAGSTRGRSGHRLRRPSHSRVATAARGSAPTSGSASTFCPTGARSPTSRWAGSSPAASLPRSSSSRTSSAAGIPVRQGPLLDHCRRVHHRRKGLGGEREGSLAFEARGCKVESLNWCHPDRAAAVGLAGPLLRVHADRFRRLPGRDAGRLGDAGSLRGESPLLRAGGHDVQVRVHLRGRACAAAGPRRSPGAFRTSRSRAADRSGSRCRASSTMPNGGSRERAGSRT